MKPYGRVKFGPHYGYYDDGYVDRGSINYLSKKAIDEQLEIWYEGWAEEYYTDLESADTYICDCSMRPDLEYFVKLSER